MSEVPPTANETTESPLCPFCSGRGTVFAFVDGIRDGRRCGWQQNIKCSICEGTGRVTPARAAAIQEGERRRQDRINRRLSGREEAARLGIDPIHLNALEHGRRTDWPVSAKESDHE